MATGYRNHTKSDKMAQAALNFPIPTIRSPNSGTTLASSPRAPRTPSPTISLPRPPRCLTPYPHQVTFGRPISSSPLSSPAISPLELNNDPFDNHASQQTPPSHGRTKSPSYLLIPTSPAKTPFRSVPISLRMSSLSTKSPTSPTDRANFKGNKQPIYLTSPSKIVIPLSPSAKQYFDTQKRNREKMKPLKIQIPSPHSQGADVPLKASQFYGTPRTALTGKAVDGGSGSVPLPRTPRLDEKTMKTAMPLTARRIGVEKRALKTAEMELEVELNVHENHDETIEDVPIFRDEPSPGWAVFEQAVSL